MFDSGRTCKKWPDDGAPLAKSVRLPKAHSMVLQRFPEDLQDIALRAFDAFVDFEALKPFGMADYIAQAAGDGFVKSGVLAGMDANVGEFKNHGGGRVQKE